MSASGLSACALLDCIRHSCCFYFSFFSPLPSLKVQFCICSACWSLWYQSHNPLIKFYWKKGSHIETNGVNMCSIGTEQIFVYYNALELGIPDNLIRKKEGPGLTADFLTLCISFGLQHHWLVHWKLPFGVKVGGQILISSGEIFWKQELISVVYK